MHNIFENTLVTTLAAGTFVGGNFGGTIGGLVPAGEYEYHGVAFLGTIANTGTINLYMCSAGGSSPRVVYSQAIGSGNGAGVGIDVKSDALGTFNASGTNYNFLTAAGTVDSGGTWRGALVILSQWARTAGTTPTALGLTAYGSVLA